ncbi:hypothetical protein INT47_008744, partial [Mucor saturninus]
FEQLQKSRWIQIYFGLVILQTVLSVPILVKTLRNTEYINNHTEEILDKENKDALFGSYFDLKGHRVIYENVLFIAYETWRLWMLTDGIVHLNSLTILASAWFSVFSCAFNVMLIFESIKWLATDDNPLKKENLHFQIGLTVAFFVLSVPVILSAYKSSKIIGWQVYRKIGSSIDLQNMYHNVQRFALVLKVDIFFQVMLLIGVAIITGHLIFCILALVLAVLIAVGLFISRIAITRESRWLMYMFLSLQLALLACNIYCIIGLFDYDDLWNIGIIYSFASIFSVVATMCLAIRCQLNFGQGLKPFVKWYPFQKKKRSDDDGLNGTEVGLINKAPPIEDDDDDSQYRKESEDSEGRFYANKIGPTSLERVDNLPYQVKVDRYLGNNKVNTIEIKDPKKPKPIVPRVAMQAINTNSLDSNRIIVSPVKPFMSDSDISERPPSYTTETLTTTITTTISLPQSEKWL